MHIVLVAFYAVSNIGDRLLTECVRQVLLNKGFSTQVVDIQGRCAFCSEDTEKERHNKQVISERNQSSRDSVIRYFRDAIESCDLVLFAGGAIFDVLSNSISENIYLICKVAESLQIPVAFNACGFYGEITSNSEKSIKLRQALLLPCVKWISVRERASDMELLLDGKKEFHFCCDTAVWASELFKISKSSRTKLIGINVISQDHFIGNRCQSVLSLYKTLYLLLTGFGLHCYFFKNGVYRGFDFAKSIIYKLGITKD